MIVVYSKYSMYRGYSVYNKWVIDNMLRVDHENRREISQRQISSCIIIIRYYNVAQFYGLFTKLKPPAFINWCQ